MRTPATPTPNQSEFLIKNFRMYSIDHLARLLNVKPWRISYWLKLLDLRKISARRKLCEKKALKKRIIPAPERKPIKRPAAEYSNTSREQHIEKWLNA